MRLNRTNDFRAPIKLGIDSDLQNLCHFNSVDFSNRTIITVKDSHLLGMTVRVI